MTAAHKRTLRDSTARLNACRSIRPVALEKQVVLDQIDAVLARCGASAERPFPPTHPPASGYIGPPSVKGNAAQMKTSLLAAIERLAPGSTHVQQAQAIATASKSQHATVTGLMGVLAALRADVEAGYTQTLAELVHADVFADFLEMAEELVDKDYKDAAAVLAGSVLEEHLRKLAQKNNVTVEKPDGKPKKADTINADLVKAGAYNKLEQKSVTAWLGTRNAAAHGDYDEYDKAQVEGLIRDVRAFMGRNPA